MAKYLITGGAGAIGSYLANHLTENKSNRVHVIDNLDSGFLDNLEKRQNLSFYQGSITDEKFMAQFESESYDYIFHLAACFANQNSIEHPDKDLQTNIKGTLTTLSLAQKQPNLKRFLYTSSSCVYGPNPKPMKETDIPNPDTPYAISKLSGEYYTNFFHQFYKLPINNLRLFNIYGSNEKPGKYRNVIPNFIHQALNNIDLLITGSANNSRDFTYIDDAISMMLNISADEKSIGETFNIGNGSPTKIGDLAKIIIEKTNSKSKIIYGPQRNWDNITNRLAETTKVNQYKSTYTTLNEGIPRAVTFIKKIIIKNQG